MPLAKIVAKAVVGSIKGKKAGEAAAAAAAKKAAAAKAAKAAKAAAAKNAKASAKGLKAAQGPSMAPKGYTADDARRAALAAKQKMSVDGKGLLFPRAHMQELARLQKIVYGEAPKNIVSKSGKKVIKPKTK
jgi:hypothetical protein